ncbi:hypothetical protein RCL1_005525 [Eukaryota sp. TZLM3-RCL]
MLFDISSTEKVLAVRQCLNTLFEYFHSDAMALFCEICSHYVLTQNFTEEKIRDIVSSSLSYLSECDYKLEIELKAETSAIPYPKIKQERSESDLLVKLMSESFSLSNLDQNDFQNKLKRPEFVHLILESWLSRASSEIRSKFLNDHVISSLISFMIFLFSSNTPFLESSLLLKIQVFSLISILVDNQSLLIETRSLAAYLLSLQPTLDLTCCVVADNQSWLATWRFYSLLSGKSNISANILNNIPARKVFEAFDTLPFQQPSNLIVDLLELKMSSLYSRSEFYNISLSIIFNLIKPQSKISDKTKRLKFWMNFLISRLDKFPPSYYQVPILITTIQSFCQSNSDGSLVFQKLSSIVESLQSNLTPICNQSDAPYLEYSLPSNSTLKQPIGYTYSAAPGSLEVPRVTSYSNNLIHFADDSIPLASINDIYLQYEDQSNLIVPKNQSNLIDENCFISTVSGFLSFYRRQISWKPIISEGKDQNSQDNSDLLALPHSVIRKWTWGEISDQNFVFFFAFFTEDSVYKFFPFNSSEVKQLSRAISDLLSLEPFESQLFVHSQIKSKLDNQRINLVQQLASHPKWHLTHTIELNKVIDDLINPAKSQSMTLLERIFHSCRYNIEVTKETLSCLKRKWQKALNNEVIRIRILNIVDRLLDRTILSRENGTFTTLEEWLVNIEEQLDPYKSPESLRLIHGLKIRGEILKRQLITPMSEYQLQNQFENLEFYSDRVAKIRDGIL